MDPLTAAVIPIQTATEANGAKAEDQVSQDTVSGAADESPMSAAEFKELADLETDISDCWWGMGLAFNEIRSKKLYRQTTDGQSQTWEEYCKGRHKLSKQYVDRLIRSSEVVTKLKSETIVSELPATPSQASELVGLTTEEMAIAASAATASAKVESRKPTARDYRKAADAVAMTKPQQRKAADSVPMTEPQLRQEATNAPMVNGSALNETADDSDGDEAATQEPSSDVLAHDARRYTVTVMMMYSRDRHVVSEILRELDIQCVTTQTGKITKLACKPLTNEMGTLLARLGGWLESNSPESFAIQVGE